MEALLERLFAPDFLTLVAAIGASLVIVGAFDLRLLQLLAAGWALHALLTSGGQTGPLAVQLTTIAVGFVIAERLNRLTHAFGRGFAPDKVRIELYKIDRDRSRVGKFEAAFVFAVALAFAWLAAPPVAPSGTTMSPAGSIAASAGPASARTAPSSTAPRSAARGSGDAVPTSAGGRSLPTAADLRHCLGAGDADAIVRCSETKD